MARQKIRNSSSFPALRLSDRFLARALPSYAVCLVEEKKAVAECGSKIYVNSYTEIEPWLSCRDLHDCDVLAGRAISRGALFYWVAAGESAFKRESFAFVVAGLFWGRPGIAGDRRAVSTSYRISLWLSNRGRGPNISAAGAGYSVCSDATAGRSFLLDKFVDCLLRDALDRYSANTSVAIKT